MQLFINTDYTFTEQQTVIFENGAILRPQFMMRGIMTHIASIQYTSYKAYAFSVAYILFWTVIIAMMVIQQSLESVTIVLCTLACFCSPFLCTGWPDCIVYCKLQRS